MTSIKKATGQNAPVTLSIYVAMTKVVGACLQSKSLYCVKVQPSTVGDAHRQWFAALPNLRDSLFVVVIMHLLSLSMVG